MRTRDEVEEVIINAVTTMGVPVTLKTGDILASVPVHGGTLDVIVRWAENDSHEAPSVKVIW